MFIKPVFGVRKIKYGPEHCGAQSPVLKASLVIIIIQPFRNIYRAIIMCWSEDGLANQCIPSMCSGPQGSTKGGPKHTCPTCEQALVFSFYKALRLDIGGWKEPPHNWEAASGRFPSDMSSSALSACILCHQVQCPSCSGSPTWASPLQDRVSHLSGAEVHT